MDDQMRHKMRIVMSRRWGYLSAWCLTGQEEKYNAIFPQFSRVSQTRNLIIDIYFFTKSWRFNYRVIFSSPCIWRNMKIVLLQMLINAHTKYFLRLSPFLVIIKFRRLKRKHKLSLSLTDDVWLWPGVERPRAPPGLCPHSSQIRDGPIPHSRGRARGTSGTWHHTQSDLWTKLTQSKQTKLNQSGTKLSSPSPQPLSPQSPQTQSQPSPTQFQP